MLCEEWRNQIDLYVDGELTSDALSAFNSHLRTCTDCASRVLERVQMKRAVHIAGRKYTASAQLRKKIEAGLPTKTSASPATWWNWALVSAMVMLLCVAGLYSYRSRENARRERIYGELTDLHVAALASSTPVDVVSSDRHTVKPWFQGRIPFTFNLPELQGSEFSLLGGRVSYFEQAPAAQLIYKIRSHEISVFIVPERITPQALATTGSVKELSFTIESWTQDGLRYFVIGDTNPADIQALSQLLKQAK